MQGNARYAEPVRALLVVVAAGLLACSPSPAPQPQAKDQPPPDLTVQPWYAQSADELAAFNRRAADLVQAGEFDQASAIVTQSQPLADRLSSPEVLWGVTSLKAHGLVFRGVALSGRSLSEGLFEVWKAAKWALCGRAATIPRKIH